MPLVLMFLLVGASAAQVPSAITIPTMTPLSETTMNHSLQPNADSSVNTSPHTETIADISRKAALTSPLTITTYSQPITDKVHTLLVVPARSEEPRGRISPVNITLPMEALTSNASTSKSQSLRPVDVTTNAEHSVTSSRLHTASTVSTTPMPSAGKPTLLVEFTAKRQESDKLPDNSSRKTALNFSVSSQNDVNNVLHPTAPSELLSRLSTEPIQIKQPYWMKTTSGFFNDAPVSHVEIPVAPSTWLTISKSSTSATSFTSLTPSPRLVPQKPSVTGADGTTSIPTSSTTPPHLRTTSASKTSVSRDAKNAVVPSATSLSILRARFTSSKPRTTTTTAAPLPTGIAPVQLKDNNQSLLSTVFPIVVAEEVEVDNSTDNCTNEYCVSDDDYLDMMLQYMFPTTYEWVLIAMHSVVFVVGLVGNALVCVAVYRNHSMRTVTNYFIVNLAVADFLVILLCLPATVLWDVTETWFMGTALCKIVLYFQTVSVAVSVLTLTFISLDRWYAICFPLKFKSTTGRAKTAIVVIWVLALTFDIPELIVLQTKRKELSVDTPFFTQCQPSWSKTADVTFHSVKTLLLYSVPLAFMTVAYCQIVKVLWSRSNIPGHMETLKESHSNGDTNSSRKMISRHMSVNMSTHGQVLCRRKAAKMLVAVVIMFAVCYFPVHLLSILRFSMDIPQTDATTAFSMVSHWLCYANSAVNPLIYNFMSGKFRLEFRRAFQQCACAWLVVCGPGASVKPIEPIKQHAHVDSHTNAHANATPNAHAHAYSVNSHAHAHAPVHVHHVKESRQTPSPQIQTRHRSHRPLHLTQMTGSTRFSPNGSLLDESQL